MQLIFTAHQTTPMSTVFMDEPLGRQQSWLCDKRPDGTTDVSPLADANPRNGEDLERADRRGVDGAGAGRSDPTPVVDTFYRGA